MKQLIKATYLSLITFLLLVFFQGLAIAQDSTASSSSSSKTTSTTTSTDQTWYTQPWVLVVGGAILVLIIVALVRGNSGTKGRSDSVTVKKTISTDSDKV